MDFHYLITGDYLIDFLYELKFNMTYFVQ